MEFCLKRLANKSEYFSSEINKNLLLNFLNETDKTIKNIDGARLYCKMMECYIMIEKYNITKYDILLQNSKYKQIINRINIYNLLYAKWKLEL